MVIRLLLLLASLSLVSCGKVQTTGPPQVTVTNTETVTVRIGDPTSIPIPTQSIQCVHVYLKGSWPVEEAISRWNQNGVNSLVVSDDPLDRCDNHVVVYEVASVGTAWGETRYVPGSATVTVLGAETPPRMRQHILCHELGHVLGLGHEQGSTCMNINKEVPLPSPEDLQTVRSKVWSWASASVSSQVH